MANKESCREVLVNKVAGLNVAPKIISDSPTTAKQRTRLQSEDAANDLLKENLTDKTDVAGDSVLSFFGSWINETKLISGEFTNAKPFEHVAIPNFLSDAACEQLIKEFPDPKNTRHNWHHYDNPIEMKYALNCFDGLPVASKMFHLLSSPEVILKIRELTGIADLEADPHLHGAGLHAYPSGGKLDTHLDYAIHPVTGKERRINIILFLNKDWNEEYGGDLQLWDAELKTCSQVMPPKYNTAVIFRTCDISYHGLPFPLKCPTDMHRRSIAIYYVSEPRPETVKRYKAKFFPHPEQKVCDNLRRLYEVRKDRRIEQEDLADWPTWRAEGGKFW
jgi:Rps23 Pro-64 3,4-dihydroxylase Tpa1-like proline 4-hydroxylase